MGLRLKKTVGRINLVVSAVLAFGVWVLIALVSTRPGYKALLDVSPQQQFSVSAETETLLDQVRGAGATLAIDTFYEPMPRQARTAEEGHWISIGRRVQQLTTDLLRRYAALGGESVEITQHDLLREPAKSRERLGELKIAKATPNSVVVTVGKRHKILSLDFDLADIELPGTNPNQMSGAARTNPTLKGYKGEEAISSAIRSLLVEGTPRVYFVKGLGETTVLEGTADSYSELAGSLQGEGFEVAELELEKTGVIPEDATIVALMEPRRELSKRSSEALFAFLRRGGRLFVNVSFWESPQDWNPTFRHLGPLLGLEVGRELVCHLVKDPRYPNSPGAGGTPLVQNIVCSRLGLHEITKPLQRAGRAPIVKAARPLRRLQDDSLQGVRVDTSLLMSGDYAWIAQRVPPTFEEVSYVAPNPNAGAGIYSARSVGCIVDVDNEDGDGRPGHAVFVSGRAFLNGDGFAINGDLALNTFNWLAQRKELVTVRGNRYKAKRLEVAPQQVRSAKLLLTAWVPGSLLVLALVVFFLRRRG